jgi:hypothetical protein
MYITMKEARIHNLITRFFKNYSNDKLEVGLTKSELSDKLFFREEDYDYVIEENILEVKGDTYVPTSKLIKEVEKMRDKKNDNDEEIENLANEYKKKFDELASDGSYTPTKELILLADKIHWHILPEYEEYMIVNSEIYPNYNTKEYYNHFHTLEDLYRELTNAGKNIESKKGDVNLNKEIGIKIYSRRWGHDDKYTIIRTTTGWNVSFHQEKEGIKEGEALIRTLEHDFINYPNSLDRFMYDLWNRADREEMSVEELKLYLERIAEWINICEKNTPEGIEE